MDMKSYISEFRDILRNVHGSTLATLKPCLEEANLTFPQFLIMELIDSSGLMMKEIAEKMAISLPAVTGFVDKLSKLEYVQRCSDPNDRRVSIINLTESGKTTLDLIQNIREERMARVFSNFDESELNDYLRLMKKLEATIIQTEAL